MDISKKQYQTVKARSKIREYVTYAIFKKYQIIYILLMDLYIQVNVC